MRLLIGFLLTFVAAAAVPVLPAIAADTGQYRAWVEEMKTAPRGPFVQLRWFCNDGAVLPPQAYACRDHGGGHQHGQWSDRTVELRDNGYKIAHILAGIDAEAQVGAPDFDDTFAQMLIERFLIGADDGWIMRRALFYRGAIQEEDERAGGRALLGEVVGEQRWVETRFAALRAGAQLLPHGQDTASAQQVRQESAALQERDAGFARLRAKIHGSPEASDAGRVREYAQGVSDADLRNRYESLADRIDEVYTAAPLADVLDDTIGSANEPAIREAATKARQMLADDDSPAGRFHASAALLAGLRDAMPETTTATGRISLLELSLRAEQAHFNAATQLRGQLGGLTRLQRLDLMASGIDAAYGCGLVKSRERVAQLEAIEQIYKDSLPLDEYRDTLRYLGRVPGWGTQNLRFLYFESMKKLADIEPKAHLFIQDQLRGSPLLFYSQVLDGLSLDGNRAAGVRHAVFGEDVGVGLKSLNPGIAIGTLHTRVDDEHLEDLEKTGIYLLPETVSDMPPVAGILTRGEGNPLSHVQLLARNLGIPNVNIDESVVDMIDSEDGKRTILAVSYGGLVHMEEGGGALEQRLVGEQTSGSVVIRPEPEKLELDVDEFISLDDLRASDSGVTVGPKAAKLGELKAAFPEAVSPGVAIPFGLFKAEILDQPYKGTSQSVFDWMVGRYEEFATLPETARATQTEAFRAELYDIIISTEPSDEFLDGLRSAMLDTFGSTDEGVFVRSDTNVEDLPGFTGAGLNLTLPNVVGFDALVESIGRVWASPFTERAFAWRQSHMVNPQHVYTSILLLRSVASEKSGVLVTQDLDTGDREVLSVAVNEGLGGAVDGQAAESLRIDTRDGSVNLLATATAPFWRRPAQSGGIEQLPASGADAVMQPAEIERLVVFARDELPERFPPIVDDEGELTAADIEFGFRNGELQLFQLRPFLQSRGAAGSEYLIEMDKSLTGTANQRVDMTAVPGR